MYYHCASILLPLCFRYADYVEPKKAIFLCLCNVSVRFESKIHKKYEKMH